MFKKLLTSTLFLPFSLTLSLTTSFADDFQETEEKINPEILELAQLKPLSDDFFDQNLYVAQFGFTYPHDNYLEIAEKVLRCSIFIICLNKLEIIVTILLKPFH